MTPAAAIFISGTGSNMQALVRHMRASGTARPCLVLSNRPDAAGLDWARAQAVPTAVVDDRPHGADRAAFETRIQEALQAARPDVICLAGFMRVLTPDFVDRWRGRILNIHPSLLPKYPGLNTHARALAAGEAEHGCTVHLVTPELDAGPVLGQSRLRIAPDDIPQTLAARVQKLEHRLYPAALDYYLEGSRAPFTL